MKQTLTNAAIIVCLSFISMGAYCSPDPPTAPAPPPPQQPTGMDPAAFKRVYEVTVSPIKDTFSKIELQEADYQDWLTRVDDKGRQSAMFATVSKRHDEIMAANTEAKSRYDALSALYEANKDAASVEVYTKVGQDGSRLMQDTNKILTDLAGLKSYQMQIKP